MDKVKATYQALWRKAFREGELWLELGSKGKAVRLRFELYNAVREVRLGKVEDPQLAEAIAACVVRVEESGRLGILAKERAGTLATILEQVDLDEFLTPTTVSLEAASLEKFKKLMQDAPQEAPTNPYYTRD